MLGRVSWGWQLLDTSVGAERAYWEGLKGRNTETDRLGGRREEERRGAEERGETELPLQKNGWAGLALGGGGKESGWSLSLKGTGC